MHRDVLGYVPASSNPAVELFLVAQQEDQKGSAPKNGFECIEDDCKRIRIGVAPALCHGDLSPINAMRYKVGHVILVDFFLEPWCERVLCQ